MKVGIIGGGFGLSVQAPIISMHPHMEVVAVSTMHRHQLPDEFFYWNNPPKHYRNWVKMLEVEELDLLFVSSLPPNHYEMVKSAMQKRIHVVCEKPFTMNSKESKQLLQLSKESEVKVIIDFEWRFLPIRQKMKQMLKDDLIGKILHFEHHVSIPQFHYLQTTKQGWQGEKDKFGGMLGAAGSHMIDCLTWLLQDDVQVVNGLLHTHIPNGAGEKRDADDAFFIHGKMKSRSTFSIQFISGVNHGFGSRINIYGSRGTISLINNQQLRFGKASDRLKKLDPLRQLKVPQHLSKEASEYYPAFYPFLEKVYEFIAFNKMDNDLPLIEDGHRNQIILDRIRGL